MDTKDSNKVIRIFSEQSADEFDRKIQAELDALTAGDLEELDPFYGTELNEERWALYKRLVDRFLDLADHDKAIMNVRHYTNPVPIDEDASFCVTLPIISSPKSETCRAIADALNLCDMFVLGAGGEKVRMTFSVHNVWKSHK